MSNIKLYVILDTQFQTFNWIATSKLWPRIPELANGVGDIEISFMYFRWKKCNSGFTIHHLFNYTTGIRVGAHFNPTCCLYNSPFLIAYTWMIYRSRKSFQNSDYEFN